VKSPCDQYGKKEGRTAPTAGAVGKFGEAVQGYWLHHSFYIFMAKINFSSINQSNGKIYCSIHREVNPRH